MTVPVVFTRCRTVQSALLRAALWSPWSHCGVVDGDEVIHATTSHGVHVTPLAQLQAGVEWALVGMPAVDPGRVIAAARGQIGKPYDWRGVLGLGIRRNWDDTERWFCSELVAWAFQAGGSPLSRFDAWRITPRDLYLPNWGTP